MILILTACVLGDEDRGDPNGTVLAVGDSVFEWNLESGQSAPQFAADDVYNASIGGTMMTGDDPIPDQYIEGNWEWILVDGGANDLNDLCACSEECGPVMDAIDEAFDRFVGERVSAGEKVLIWGYYDPPSNAEFDFGECGEEVDELAVRQAAVAETYDGVWFVDGRELSRDGLFDEDRIHPSVEGSQAIGEQLRLAMETEDGPD